jgi:hypothetical protein
LIPNSRAHINTKKMQDNMNATINYKSLNQVNNL